MTTGTPAARRSFWWGAIAATFLLLVLPLLLVDTPPLLDYPNHMARMYVLAFGAADPILSQMYAAHWAIIPNLALDLLIPPALAILPLDIAGRIAIGLAILLPVAGCIALSHAVFARRLYWPLLSAMAAYNVALRLGLLNFLIAIGLALLLAAAWTTWRDTRPALAIALAALAMPALFFCHIMGVALALLLLGCREICAANSWASAARRLVVLAAVAAVPTALFLASPVAKTQTIAVWPPVSAKILGVFAGFICDNVFLDSAAGALCLLFIYGCVRSGRARTSIWLAVAFAVLAIGYAVAPIYFKGTGFFATRFSVMATFLLFAGFAPRCLPPRAAALAGVALVALFAARMGNIALQWHAHAHDLAELRETIAPVAPGSRVMVTYVAPTEAPDYWAHAPAARTIPTVFQADLHEAALLLTERRAFWPSLFANADQQPVIVLPPYSEIATPHGDTPPHLVLSGQAGAATAALFDIPPGWRQKFDFLLILDAGGEPDLAGWAGPGMTLLRQTDAAALFRIEPLK